MVNVSATQAGRARSAVCAMTSVRYQTATDTVTATTANAPAPEVLRASSVRKVSS